MVSMANTGGILETLTELGKLLVQLAGQLVELGLAWFLLIFWLAWCTAAVDWKKTWKVLGQGAWIPLVLLAILAALVWSQIRPSDWQVVPGLAVMNFWWQLGVIALLLGSAFFCGWVQSWCGCAPPEVNLEPPAHGGHHGHHAAH